MGLPERLKRLEEHAVSTRGPSAEEWERKWWFVRMGISRMDALHSADARDALGLVRLFRTQGILEGMDFAGLVGKILAWRPIPEGGRCRNTVEREVSLAIHRRERGTEHLACPGEWREAFEAGQELLGRYEAASDEGLAVVYAGLMGCEDREDTEGVNEWNRRLREEVVGAADLLERAEGPGAEEIPDDERLRRLEETLAEAFYGEKHYRVWRHLQRLKQGEEEGAAERFEQANERGKRWG